MISFFTIRRICAAIDAFAITCIAAGISKSVKKRDLSNYAHSASHHPENFPTIASCRAALSKKAEIQPPKQKIENDLDPQENTNEPEIIIKIKKERDPEKLFSLFHEHSSNHHASCIATLLKKGEIQAPKPKKENTNEPGIIKIKKERDPEKLFSLFQSNAQNRIVVENRFIFEDTISRLAGARRFDLIEQILEHQKGLPQGRREGFLIRVITLYGRAHMSDHAVETFQEMHLFGCKRTVKSFNATLKVLSQAGRFYELCHFFDEAPEKYGIQFDEISYNTIIKVMCQMDNLESAYRIMLEMGKSGIQPDVVTYTTLISAFYKKGLRKIGDGLWNLMRLRGCNPTLATYNVRIQYLINRRRTFEANDLVRSMYKSGIKPDEVSYNLIIKGFFMMGEVQMAITVFNAMSRRDCEPNEKIYQTMIHYLCEERDFDLAFNFFKGSMERNWFPSVDTIKKLLKGLLYVSKETHANEIMRLVVGKMPRYSSDVIMSFQKIMSH